MFFIIFSVPSKNDIYLKEDGCLEYMIETAVCFLQHNRHIFEGPFGLFLDVLWDQFGCLRVDAKLSWKEHHSIVHSDCRVRSNCFGPFDCVKRPNEGFHYVLDIKRYKQSRTYDIIRSSSERWSIGFDQVKVSWILLVHWLPVVSAFLLCSGLSSLSKIGHLIFIIHFLIQDVNIGLFRLHKVPEHLLIIFHHSTVLLEGPLDIFIFLIPKNITHGILPIATKLQIVLKTEIDKALSSFVKKSDFWSIICDYSVEHCIVGTWYIWLFWSHHTSQTLKHLSSWALVDIDLDSYSCIWQVYRLITYPR